MNRLKQAGIAIAALCAGVVLLLGTAWMAERSAAQTFGPAVVNGEGPRANRPYNRTDSYPDNGSERPKKDPIPDGESVYEDFDVIRDPKRLKERPGNFGALAAVANFLEGQYQIKPELCSVVFPLFFDSSTPLNEQADWDKQFEKMEKRAREKGEKLKNPMRRWNWVMKEIRMIDIADTAKLPLAEIKAMTEEEDGPKGALTRVPLVAEKHKGRAVLIKIRMHREYLEADKAGKDDSGEALLFMVVQSGEEWKVAYFDD